jgi:hypothetical protein
MLVIDVATRLQQLYAVPAMAHALEYAFNREPGDDGDVWDGDHFTSITKGTCFIHRMYV